MKKSTIWLLTIVMAVTFGALLYYQIMYLENMAKMRDQQFSESVMRSLYATSNYLDRQETMYYLEQDVAAIESGLLDEISSPEASTTMAPDGMIPEIAETAQSAPPSVGYPSPNSSVSTRYQSMQETLRSQYLYQRGLLNEVILEILSEAGNRPVFERADSVKLRQFLTAELANNGLDVPFEFSVTDQKGQILYASAGYPEEGSKDNLYECLLFPHSSTHYTLSVYFPTKTNYIFSSVRFIIPSLSFTLILLVVFIFTVMLAFRQKKLTEMKTDFINNMTHELKTPISTILLAAQMLGDDSVRKSPTTLNHLSEVISEESKRLRFQVEKVLQMSVLDNSSAALKFSEIDANTVISNVVNTFKIKVEKYGGSLTMDLDAQNALVNVDEMHFTNVIFNLLDNAVKYRREDVEPHFRVSTRDVSDRRLEIRISDNGIGIRKDDLKRIFEKFYRVSTGNRHDVKGFGLGLAYVKRMIGIFDGTISVESELGVGTTFTILLPLVPPAENEKRGYENEKNAD